MYLSTQLSYRSIHKYSADISDCGITYLSICT